MNEQEMTDADKREIYKKVLNKSNQIIDLLSECDDLMPRDNGMNHIIYLTVSARDAILKMNRIVSCQIGGIYE